MGRIQAGLGRRIRMKSASANIGATTLAACCLATEGYARNADACAAGASLLSLEKELIRAVFALGNERATA
jgi:hypothetical protein